VLVGSFRSSSISPPMIILWVSLYFWWSSYNWSIASWYSVRWFLLPFAGRYTDVNIIHGLQLCFISTHCILSDPNYWFCHMVNIFFLFRILEACILAESDHIYVSALSLTHAWFDLLKSEDRHCFYLYEVVTVPLQPNIQL
jgi:hypothetical protein